MIKCPMCQRRLLDLDRQVRKMEDRIKDLEAENRGLQQNVDFLQESLRVRDHSLEVKERLMEELTRTVDGLADTAANLERDRAVMSEGVLEKALETLMGFCERPAPVLDMRDAETPVPTPGNTAGEGLINSQRKTISRLLDQNKGLGRSPNE